MSDQHPTTSELMDEEYWRQIREDLEYGDRHPDEPCGLWWIISTLLASVIAGAALGVIALGFYVAFGGWS